MSFDYTTLFTRIGTFAGQITAWQNYQANKIMGASQGADAVLGEYTNNQARAIVGDVLTSYTGFAAQVGNWEKYAKSKVDAVLQDSQQALSCPTSNVTTLLTYLYNQMVIDSQSVAANTIGSVTITPNGSNVGNGVLLASKQTYAGIDDQRITTESVRVKCNTDQFTGGIAGSETFEIVGTLSTDTYSYLPLGHGTSSITVNDGNQLTNGSFATAFTAGTAPPGWTVAAGVSTLSQGTALPHNPLSGGYLIITGDSATTTVTLTQALSVTANSIYACSCFVRKNGTVATGSTLTISITGTGLTPVVLYTGDPNGLTTSYALKSAWLNIGPTYPADLAIKITITAANNIAAAGSILIDDVQVQTPTTFGHVQYALVRGSTDFQVNDFITSATTVSSASNFQTFFARFYDYVLPSSGSPTITDSLAAVPYS